MAVGITLLVISVLILAIWLIVEMKRMRHKVFAVFLIVLILVSYFSFSFVLKDKEINLTTIEGIKTASILYFSWLGTVFSNFKTITSKAIKMDWKGNETS
ncbi:hypothetical protein KAT24_00555 [Candidatus Pacearchaeota archaeon]|nr:hypothetical protein [Candidatus Pacearchaeota archaeon]